MYITVYLYIYPSRTWGCSGHDFLVILPLDVNPREDTRYHPPLQRIWVSFIWVSWKPPANLAG